MNRLLLKCILFVMISGIVLWGAHMGRQSDEDTVKPYHAGEDVTLPKSNEDWIGHDTILSFPATGEIKFR